MPWVPVDLDSDADPFPATADPAEVLAELSRLLERPAWHREAACRGQGPSAWFPTRGQSTDPARQVCAACPVAGPCLEAGLAEHHGVWGGSSERGRRHLRRDAA